jgi:hypothetical protein
MSGFTILEREVWAAPRNHVVWARTSHVDDPLKFVVPAGLASPRHDELRLSMIADRDAGASQDEWRTHLPIVSETAWTTRVSLRDLVKVGEYFNYLGTKVVDRNLSTRLVDVSSGIFGVVVEAFEVEPELLGQMRQSYSRVKFLNEEPVAADGASAETAGHLAFKLRVPIWLRAQIVRHRPLLFVDDFFDAIVGPRVRDATIGDEVTMELAATRSYWQSVLEKRSCWILQDEIRGKRDPWQMIIDRFGFSEDMLPCRDGKCPYFQDAKMRLVGLDPGVPCPEYCDIYGVDKAPYKEAMLRAAKSRHPFWLERI